MNIRKILFFLITILLGTVLYAQNPKEYLKVNPERTGCVYHSYEAPLQADQPQLKGYEPFYISHYGRHGSRWHTSGSTYTKPLKLLRKASEKEALTPLGDSLLQKMEIIADDAYLRYGDLSPRGVREHRGIAERMYKNYPAVFKSRRGIDPNIESRSTLVIRCVLSMAAFNERLKELNPRLNMTRESSKRYIYYLDGSEGGESQYDAAKAVSDSLQKVWLSPERFINSIFSDKKFIKSNIKKPHKVMYDFFKIASIMQDVDYLGISLYDLFTENELYDLWRCLNAHCYLTMGASPRFGDYMLNDAKPLLKNIVETAQDVIDKKDDVAATLRFGHDSDVIPLVALMGIKGASDRVPVERIADVWNVSEVTPMAANVQFIFYHDKNNDIRVRVLLNERDAQLPIEGAPFYEWNELKSYLESKYK